MNLSTRLFILSSFFAKDRALSPNVTIRSLLLNIHIIFSCKEFSLFFSNNSPLAFSMGKELSGSVVTPLLNPFICSGIAPTAEAITGKLQDKASDIARPQVSILDDCM